jgi:hypothetical protein
MLHDIPQGRLFSPGQSLALSQLGLEIVVGTDADTTMEVGKLYLVDMSGWATAHRTYTAPPSFKVGQRWGIYVLKGNASFELIIKPNTGDKINDGSAAAEWSRLFMTGESAVAFGTIEDTEWGIFHDGRIPCRVSIFGDYTHTSSASYQTTDLAATNTVVNDGAMLGIASDVLATVRRAGIYSVSGHAHTLLGTADKRCGILFRNNTASLHGGALVGGPVSMRPIMQVSVSRSFADGDVVDFQLWQDDSASEAMSYSAEMMELLRR